MDNETHVGPFEIVDSGPMGSVDGLKASPEFDSQGNIILAIQCPRCGATIRHEMRTLFAGSEVTCTCGFSYTVTDDSFLSAGRNFESFKREIENFGK